MRVLMTGVLAATLALAGCSKTPELAVSDAVVRLPAVAGQPGVAYFTVEGGPTDDRLALVTADYAIRTEIHESMKSGAMMTMKPLASGVAIPAGQKVEFKPGGLHVMLFDLRPGLKSGMRMPLTLRFAEKSLTINAEIKSAGE